MPNQFQVFLLILSRTEWHHINMAWLPRLFQNVSLQSGFFQDEFLREGRQFGGWNFSEWRSWMFTWYRQGHKKVSFLEWSPLRNIFGPFVCYVTYLGILWGGTSYTFLSPLSLINSNGWILLIGLHLMNYLYIIILNEWLHVCFMNNCVEIIIDWLVTEVSSLGNWKTMYLQILWKLFLGNIQQSFNL